MANQTGRTVTVDLKLVRTNATVLSLAVPGRSTGRVTKTVVPGSYEFSCHLRSGVVVLSGSQKVGLDPIPGTPHAPIGPGITRGVMAPVIRKYRTYAMGELEVVSTDVSHMTSTINSGSRSAAEQAWYAAFYSWAGLGGTYGFLGAPGAQIDETANALPDGVDSLGFVGFHKVELDLWQGKSLAQAGSDAAVLARLVMQLKVALPTTSIPAAALPTRAHEMLEDVLRDDLSGDDDYGSGSELGVVAAGVSATKELFVLFQTLLALRAPSLEHEAASKLAAIDAAIAPEKTSTGWVPLEQVPQLRREQIDAAVSSALEVLSEVPAVLRLGGSGGDGT